MKIDIISHLWGTPLGASNGMGMATAFLAETLGRLGHEIRRPSAIVDGKADLIITSVAHSWDRTVGQAKRFGALERLVYWHHAGGVPRNGAGCVLAAPPTIPPALGWAQRVTLPPSSWAIEAGGECTGTDVLVSGASPGKGGHVSRAVAQLCPDLRFYVLEGRSAQSDRAPWRGMANAELAAGVADPAAFLARAGVVLSPTRFETYGLLLAEAAVRAIPVVCTDLPATRDALGDSAIYVPIGGAAPEWSAALRKAIERQPPLPRLRLRPYADVVRDVVVDLLRERAA